MVHCAHLVAVVKVNNKVMREFRQNGSDTVYLPFGSEYEICFNNLSSYRAVVSVEIDGKDALAGNKIVIEANSESSLKGYMDAEGNLAKNSFKFIKMTDKIAEHRGTDSRDGLIRIEYQFEKPYEPPSYRPIKKVWDTSNWDDYPWRRKGIYPNPGDIWYCSSSNQNSHDTSFLRGKTKGVGGSSASNQIRPASINMSSCANDSYSNSDKGITAAGSIVNQRFGSTYVRELFPEKHVIVFELRGENKKGKNISAPVTVKSKQKCDNCGTVNKSNTKFCRECGTSLI